MYNLLSITKNQLENAIPELDLALKNKDLKTIFDLAHKMGLSLNIGFEILGDLGNRMKNAKNLDDVLKIRPSMEAEIQYLLAHVDFGLKSD